jgi:hypothetical protein
LFDSLQYRVQRCRLETFCKSFFPSTIRLWNSLEPNCKSIVTTLEYAMHYLLECPLYTNARMQLFINITLYTVISIENVLLGSDNLTGENNLAELRNI